MMKFFKDILTGIDGKTYDNIRVYMMFSVFVFLGSSVWHLYDENVFDPVAFGSGLAAIFAAGGAGILMKKDTEPK